MNLLWRVNPEPWNPENIEPECAGWRAEQAAWHSGVSISDLSHHMFDTFIAGPDATALLTAVSANNYESFAIGQAKQFIPVTSRGSIVTDGILERTAEQGYTLSGIPAAQNWVKYHGEQGGYDVSFSTDPSSAFRGGADPRLFRYQVQGPLARDLVESVFGGPLPPAKFFHSVPAVLDGMEFRALRHNMAGQDGCRVHRALAVRRGREGHAATGRREVRPGVRRGARLRVGQRGKRVDPLADPGYLHRSGPGRVPGVAPAVRDRGASGRWTGRSSLRTSRTTTARCTSRLRAGRSRSTTISSGATRCLRRATP